MKRKDIEALAREAAVILAWCVHRLPVSEWVNWGVLFFDLLAAQSDITNDIIEDTLIELHSKIEIRLARGQW